MELKVDSKEACLNPEKEFMDTIRSRPWEVWKDFITMFACSLSNPLDKSNFNGREVSYMQIVCNMRTMRRILRNCYRK